MSIIIMDFVGGWVGGGFKYKLPWLDYRFILDSK